MIERILDTGKLQAGEPLDLHFEECDLRNLILDTVSDLKVVHGDCIQVNAKTPVLGMWDAEFLGRSIENILGNAIKYRTPTTPITVTLR